MNCVIYGMVVTDERGKGGDRERGKLLGDGRWSLQLL